MRREGRQALLDALLIADVGKDGRKNAHGAAVVTGAVSYTHLDVYKRQVHGTALVGAVGQSIHFFIHFLGLYPVVRGACVLFLFTADELSLIHI